MFELGLQVLFAIHMIHASQVHVFDAIPGVISVRGLASPNCCGGKEDQKSFPVMHRGRSASLSETGQSWDFPCLYNLLNISIESL